MDPFSVVLVMALLHSMPSVSGRKDRIRVCEGTGQGLSLVPEAANLSDARCTWIQTLFHGRGGGGQHTFASTNVVYSFLLSCSYNIID
jgi:hypothetical protein